MTASRPGLSKVERTPVGALGLVEPPPIVIECDAFSGTLATLFLCVRESRLNLMEVPLFPICRAYFEYLLNSPLANLNESATALAALAYLLERKAWGLLPNEDEAPEETELESPLALEGSVGLFEESIQTLLVYKDNRERLFFRSNRDLADAFQPELDIASVSVSELAEYFKSILEKAMPDLNPPAMRSRRNLAEVMRELLVKMGSEWVLFLEVLPERFTTEDVVYCFLAMLELIKLGQVQLDFRDGGIAIARASNERK